MVDMGQSPKLRKKHLQQWQFYSELMRRTAVPQIPGLWSWKVVFFVSDESKLKLHWFCNYCLYLGITFLLITRILIFYLENTIKHYTLSKQKEHHTFLHRQYLKMSPKLCNLNNIYVSLTNLKDCDHSWFKTNFPLVFSI